MKKKDKYGNSGYGDLLRYVQGEMSDEERHALEKDLQKDLFAYEALEGLSNQRIEEVREDLERLESQLNKRVKSRRSLTWVRIAASVAVLLTIGTLYLTVFTDIIIQTDRMAVETESPEPAREERPTEMSEDPLKSGTREQKTAESGQALEDAPTERAARVEIQESSPESATGPGPEKSVEKDRDNEEILVSEDLAVSEEVIADAMPDKRDEVFEEEEETMDHQEEIVVASEFAYEVETAPSRSANIARPAAIEVAPATEATVEKESRMAAKKLSGPAQRQVLPAAIMLSDSSLSNPEGGMTEFRKYIDDNLNFPDGESKNTAAIVILSFSSDSSGRPMDIKIIESSGEAFSKEAIRLLEEGPDWFTVQGQPLIQINFIPVE